MDFEIPYKDNKIKYRKICDCNTEGSGSCFDIDFYVRFRLYKTDDRYDGNDIGEIEIDRVECTNCATEMKPVTTT